MRRNHKKGFTLVELLVVIGIIGILAAMVLPKFTGYVDKAKEKQALSVLRSIHTEMVAYYAENGDYIPSKDFNGVNDASKVLKKLGIKGELTYQEFTGDDSNSPHDSQYYLDKFWYYDEDNRAFGFWNNKYYKQNLETNGWEEI